LIPKGVTSIRKTGKEEYKKENQGNQGFVDVLFIVILPKYNLIFYSRFVSNLNIR